MQVFVDAFPFVGLLDVFQQFTEVGGFHNIVECTELHPLEPGLNRSMAREYDHLDERFLLLEQFQRLDPIHPRHQHVQNHHIKAFVFDDFERLFPAVNTGSIYFASLQTHHDGLQKIGLIINDQNPEIFHSTTPSRPGNPVLLPPPACYSPLTGKETVKVAPFPTSLATIILPPSFSTML